MLICLFALLIFETIFFFGLGALIPSLLAFFCAAVCFYLIWFHLPPNVSINHFWRKGAFPIWRGSKIHRLDTDKETFYFWVNKNRAYKEFYQVTNHFFIER